MLLVTVDKRRACRLQSRVSDDRVHVQPKGGEGMRALAPNSVRDAAADGSRVEVWITGGWSSTPNESAPGANVT
jgi:hypothetical protein